MTSDAPHSDNGSPATASRPGRLQARFTGALLGAAVTLVGLLIWLIATRGQALPEMTDEQFLAARQRWDREGPSSYFIRVEVRGRQPALYEVRVRDGEVLEASRNGNPLKQRRTMGTWSVPGMFYTIEQDVRHRRRHREGQAEVGEPNVQLRAVFDEQYGYPVRYHRTELVRLGTNPVTTWDVVQFEPRE